MLGVGGGFTAAYHANNRPAAPRSHAQLRSRVAAFVLLSPRSSWSRRNMFNTDNIEMLHKVYNRP